MPAQTVTLLGTPEQAETLTLASADARIQLVLRNGSDQTIEKTPGRRCRGIVRRSRVAQEEPENTAATAPSPASGGGRGSSAAASAARSDRGDSRNAEERGSSGAGRRGKVNHATNETAVHPVWAAGLGRGQLAFGSRRPGRDSPDGRKEHRHRLSGRYRADFHQQSGRRGRFARYRARGSGAWQERSEP